MRATDILMEEHRVIERVITALEVGADRLEGGQAIRPEFFSAVTDFITGFADGYHHKKEEGVLFPSMFAHGAPAQGGPVNVMLAEHELARKYTRGLRSATERLVQGEPEARGEIVHFARGYAQLLRQHILKENMILFPMAQKMLPSQAQEQVNLDFETIAQAENGAGAPKKYLALADTLEAEMGTAWPNGGDE